MSYRYRTTRTGSSSIQSALFAGFVSIAILAGVTAFENKPDDNQPVVHASVLN